MFTDLLDLYSKASQWANANQGVVAISLFVVALVFGWASGIFSALRRRPRFKISLIDGPTFCCTYTTGKSHGNFEVHRTGIALYLAIANVGSAPSSIDRISVGYHWHLHPLSIHWLRYSLGWFWLSDQAVALADFQVSVGENIKVYPFLIQQSTLLPAAPRTYLEVGRATNGVVYFEQLDSWGGCFPRVRNSRVRLRVQVHDAFGNKHSKSFWVPSVTLGDARKYNPSFGKTLAELRGEMLPFDGT